jgi:hypothetical protein
MALDAEFMHVSSGPDIKRNFILQQGLCEPHGRNLSASLFCASLPALASRSLGHSCHFSGAIPLLRSRNGALVELIGPAFESIRCVLQSDPGALGWY